MTALRSLAFNLWFFGMSLALELYGTALAPFRGEEMVQALTRRWAKLIVVTGFYHMPRALTEFRRALPDVRLVPVPVRPPGLRRWDGLTHWVGLRLMTEEYMKFLAAQVGLTTLWPGPGPILQTAAPPRRPA